jgi:hypothetical protein
MFSFSSFIFSLPSALPPPFHMYGFVILRPDTSYINCTVAWLYNFVHFVNLSPRLLVISLLVEPLISYPTMAPKKNLDAASKASTATPYELLHFFNYKATLLMPGASAVPEVAPLKGLSNHLSLSMMRLKKCLYPLFLCVFNLTAY